MWIKEVFSCLAVHKIRNKFTQLHLSPVDGIVGNVGNLTRKSNWQGLNAPDWWQLTQKEDQKLQFFAPPLHCKSRFISRSGGDLKSFSSKECTDMKYVSFHVLSQVRKLFLSDRLGQHLLLFLPGVTAYLFRNGFYRLASACYMAELWIHKWQMGSNCQPQCPKGELGS